PDVESSRRRIEALEGELAIIGRERTVGVDTGSRDAIADASLEEEKKQLTGLEARWKSEKALVDRVLAIRADLRAEAVRAAASPDGAATGAPAPEKTDDAAKSSKDGNTRKGEEKSRGELLSEL